MAITNSGRLFDVTMRLALFVEGIRIEQQREFRAVLAAVEEDVRKLLGQVKYQTLDGLTKAELNKLLVALRKSQLKVYTAYTEKFIASLEEFMRVRSDVTAMAYASVKYSFDNKPKQFGEVEAYEYIERENKALPIIPIFGLAAILPSGKPSLWSTIKNAPIPANGTLLIPFIQTFAKSAQASVENTVRRAWANKQTVAATIDEIAGAKTRQGNSTQLAKVQAQANAVIDTALGHVDQISLAAIVSAIFEWYEWLSVIDGHTTPFCIRTDGKIFKYGEGPLPPAHYRCRSTTMPLASRFDDFDTPTLYAWLKGQPREIQLEFLPEAAVSALNDGRLKAKDFATTAVGKPLQINGLKAKLKTILT